MNYLIPAYFCVHAQEGDDVSSARDRFCGLIRDISSHLADAQQRADLILNHMGEYMCAAGRLAEQLADQMQATAGLVGLLEDARKNAERLDRIVGATNRSQ